MTTEELLKRRWKVISDYPNSPFFIGQVFVIPNFDNQFTKDYWAAEKNKFPHLFEPLPWWKERKVEDLPEYVKITGTGCSIIRDSIVKTEGAGVFDDPSFHNEGDLYVLVRDKYFDEHGLTRMNCKNCEPATKKEYEAYIKGKEDKQ